MGSCRAGSGQKLLQWPITKSCSSTTFASTPHLGGGGLGGGLFPTTGGGGARGEGLFGGGLWRMGLGGGAAWGAGAGATGVAGGGGVPAGAGAGEGWAVAPATRSSRARKLAFMGTPTR